MNFFPLLIVVVLAFIVPLLISRVKRVPVVVGEILAGMLIGNAGLGLVHGKDITLELLAEIGFAFLMFLSGLEIDFNLLFESRVEGKKKGLHPIWLGLISFGITVFLSIGIGFGLAAGGLARDPWMMALILSTTSLGIVVPVLKERKLSGSKYGQTVLLGALLADFFTMFLITVYVAVRSRGLTLDILLITVLFAAFVLVYRFGVRQLQRPSVRTIMEDLSGATSQLKVRGAIALMMAFVALAGLLGVELILGAFLAGAVASLLSTQQEEGLREKLDALGFGFFVPVFFIMVGVRFDLQAFLSDPSAWLLAPLLLATSFLIKIISGLIFKLNFSWRETLAGGFLLSARLSLIIAAAAIGVRLEVISPATNAAIILVAALTSVSAPLAFNLLMPVKVEKEVSRMIIFGSSDIGLRVAQVLRDHGEMVHFFELDHRAVGHVKEKGFEATLADTLAQGFELLLQNPVQALLALSSEDTQNLLVSYQAIQYGIPHVVSLVNDPKRIEEFRSLGVMAFSPALYQPTLLALMARNPDLFNLLTHTTNEQDVCEVHLCNPILAGEKLSNLGLAGELLVLSIGRKDELIIPHGNTRLEIGDRLTLLGKSEDIQREIQRLESEVPV